MLTYACTASCNNCGTLSTPSDKNILSLDIALNAIEQANALGFANVVFTGGESTLRWNDLLSAIQKATELQMPTRLVTNAHWATSVDRATALLSELANVGLDEINFSTGDQHIRFVPLQRVVFATLSAVKNNMPVHTMIELTAERSISVNDYLQHPLVQELSDREKRLITATESPWMPLDSNQVACYPSNYVRNQDNVLKSTGCDSVLQTYVVQADGRVGSCCGLGMRKVPELSVGMAEGNAFLETAIERAEDDFLKLWLRFQGPEKILAWAAQFDPTILWENKYAHCCQACMRIYDDSRVQQVIKEHYTEIVPEVIKLAWLNEYYLPGKLFQDIDN
ncbi:radical SAM protein [Beijerinckia indica]